MAIISTITYSGFPYTFDVVTLDHEFDEVAAIYMFIKRYIGNNKYLHKILYIGQTQNLKQRISGHEKLDCALSHGCTHISVYKFIGTDEERKEIEAQLISDKKPICNEQLNPNA